MDLLTILSLPLVYVVPFLVVLGIIVFVHELGHFLVARWCGVKVDVFSIGFGKELFGFDDRYGTHWKFGWILLGGYVKFEGDANAASLPDGSRQEKITPTMLQAKPIWQRMAVVAAGPIANFLLAIVIFAGAFMIVGTTEVAPVIGSVEANSAAEKAGIKPEDLVTKIDGQDITSFTDISRTVWGKAGQTFKFEVKRGNDILTLDVTPQVKEEDDGFNGKYSRAFVGVGSKNSPETVRHQRLGPVDALVAGTTETASITGAIVKSVGRLIVGQESAKQIGGPIAIAKGASDAVNSGLLRFVSFIAFISISVGIMNLFPIPMLDGGHLLFYSIEAVAGKPLGPKAQEWSFRVGLSIVFMLMAFGMFNDLGRVVARWTGG